MASPQPDKFTKISNELLEAKARIRLSGEENQIWDVLLRKTYGFNKKMDVISLSQFALKTGLVKPSICRALNKLLIKNMINKKANANSVTYGIQKNYDEWKPLTKKLIVSKNANLINKSANNRLQKSDTQKKVLKETILKIVGTGSPPAHLTDTAFILALKDNLAYRHIDLDVELAKMDAWLLTNRGRKKTKRFVVNWLNKIDKPLAIGKPKSSIGGLL